MSSKVLTQLGRQALRYPFGASCLLLSILLAGANLWLYYDNLDLEVRQQARAQEGGKMLKSIGRGSQLRIELTATRAATQRVAESLVVEKNTPDNYWYFYKIEQDTGAKLTELQQHAASLPDTGAAVSYKRVPYSLKLAGSFHSMMAYLHQVEAGPRFARINSFQLQRQDPVTSNVVLQLDLELLGAR